MRRAFAQVGLLLALGWIGVAYILIRPESFNPSARENLAWMLLIWISTCALISASLVTKLVKSTSSKSNSEIPGVWRVLLWIGGANAMHVWLVILMTNWLFSMSSHYLAATFGFFLGVMTLIAGAAVPVALGCFLRLVTS